MRGVKLVGLVAVTVMVAGCGGSSSSTTSQGPPTGGASTTSAAPTTGSTATAPTAPVQSMLLFATAHPNYPPVVPGKVAVVTHGPPTTDPSGSTLLPIIVRNGTTKTMTDIQVATPP